MKEEISRGVYGKVIPPFLSAERSIPLLGGGRSLDLQRKICGDAVSLVCWLEGVLVSGLWWKKWSVISVREGRSCLRSSNSLIKALCLIFFPSNLLSAVATKITKKR